MPRGGIRKEEAARASTGISKGGAIVVDTPKLGKKAAKRAQRVQRVAVAVEKVKAAGANAETAHDCKKRHTAEYKAVKAQVMQLKKQRKRQPKKGGKDEKKEISQEIRKLLNDVQEKHEAELKALGIDNAQAGDITPWDASYP